MTDREVPQIIVLTDRMAAGKSTVAQALAERLPKSVHLPGDIYRKLIVNGREAWVLTCRRRRGGNFDCATTSLAMPRQNMPLRAFRSAMSPR
jgi:dephospho-CoA kinase